MEPNDFTFDVGDRVIIRDVEQCPFGYNDDMIQAQAEGKEYTIRSRSLGASKNGYVNVYRLYESIWAWGEINFELASKAASEEDIAAILLN